MINKYIGVLFLSLLLFGGCRKKNGTGKEEDSVKISTLEKTRDYYLWYDQIPANFNTSSYSDPQDILQAVRQYSYEPGFSYPVDYFSFAMKKDEWNKISAGEATDFGLNAFFFSDTDLRVRMVEPNSPAGAAGIRRGWRITSLGGSTNITTNNADFIRNQLYNSTSTSFAFSLPDGSTKNITLTAADYQEQPLYLDTIYTIGGKKIGYLVFNSFLGNVEGATNAINNVFAKFVGQHVTEVIVDLRYNGGGYVSLQETLANYLVNSSANDKVMMIEEFNDKHSADNKILRFFKLGALNINNVYFIVGGNTASASELLINNLKPYMNVKIVGDNTYGKPVGFFGIPVDNWYIFPVSFRSVNASGVGNYFEGIPVDAPATDGLNKDWGDISEPSLATALNHIQTGSFGYAPQEQAMNSVLAAEVNDANKLLNKSIKGAFIR